MAVEVKAPKKRKGTPPKVEQPLKNNLDKVAASELVGLSFKITPEFRKEYRTYAAEKDMSLVDILRQSFDLYREQNPI